ncbi:MAG: Gfo/Idh/MocA family oxidoreductase [Verrucomicrobia bacterium]|nr:Gfo/Idh/MocA family oxidoreductase [Verrucomicrobiota bacterium]
MKRREFLKRSAGALAIACHPDLLPAAARGANEKITLGCIGVGGMGTGNLKNFLGLEDCRVVAVCDVQADRRAKARQLVDQKYGDQGCAAYGDFREVLARPDIDAVMIATQDHWHAVIATAALAAGKDLYCEKPMGVSVEEGQKILAAVRRHRRVFQAGTWQRSQAKFRRACELVRNGYIGTLREIQVAAPGPQYQPKYEGALGPQPAPAGFDWAMWRGPAPDQPFNPGRVAWPDWYLIWDYCAGFICNWGVHHLDIAHWGCPRIAQEPCEIECQGVYRRKGFTDNIESWQATFTFSGGLRMLFSDPGRQKVGTRFVGDKGWVHVDRAGFWAEPESLLKHTLSEQEIHLHRSDNHGDDFLRSVRSRRDPVSDAHATHVASYLGLLAEIAARLQTKLTWDPRLERFVGHDEANARLRRPLHHGWTLT